MSEQAKLLVAVSKGGRAAVVLGAAGAIHFSVCTSAWTRDDLDALGSAGADVEGGGVFAWEGTIAYREDALPKWTGAWRPPQADEWDRLARGVPVWGEP